MRTRTRHLYPVTALAVALAMCSAANAAEEDASVRIDPRHQDGRDVPDHFVGFSIEWTLIERYMGPNARQGFAKLLDNLDSGVLRIGGGSQDNVPFDAAAPNTNRVITPQDLAAIRATLDLANGDSSEEPPGPPCSERVWLSSPSDRSPRLTTRGGSRPRGWRRTSPTR